MKFFVIYDLVTGAIIRGKGMCQDIDLMTQARDGEGLIPDAQADWKTQRVDASVTPPVIVDYTPPGPTLTEKQNELVALCAAIRFEKETGGIMVNGASIATDRESQALMTGAWVSAQNNPDFTADWKAENGWVSIDASTIVSMAQAIATWVNDCFRRERVLSDLVRACVTIEDAEGLRPTITAFWPQ